MEINGVPLHPLVVHGAVVLSPLAALISLVYAGSARWRERLHSLAVLGALVGSGAIFAAWYTGRDLLADRREEGLFSPQDLDQIAVHQDRANILAWLAIAYVVLAVAAWVTRAQSAGRIVRVLLGVVAVGVLALAVLAGDAGARAVWS